METVEEFLAYAMNLEREAAERFGQLADAMESSGNRDVGKLFRQLSEYSESIMPRRKPGRASGTSPT